MLTVDEALGLILADLTPLAAEEVDLQAALGRVLREDVYASANVPPFANSSMDGYAVRAVDTTAAQQDTPVSLRVVGNLAAGYRSARSLGVGETMRIMTGAPLPPGADAVVRFEDSSDAPTLDHRHYRGLDGVGSAPGSDSPPATVQVMVAVGPGDYTRVAGEDIRLGELVLIAGTRLRPAELGVLASLGRAHVQVARRPRVAILATGDELVAADGVLDATRGQIYDSNGYSLVAAVQQLGGEPLSLGIARDNVADLAAKFDLGIAAGTDLFITAGGVSYGDYDIVKNMLIERGKMNFWQVSLRPGKPLVFGRLQGVPLLGLPGNPVSALVSFDVFARPAILALMGGPPRPLVSVPATLLEDVQNGGGRRFYCRMVASYDPASGYTARSSGAQGSGILTSISRANAYLVVPEDVSLVTAGSQVNLLLFEQ